MNKYTCIKHVSIWLILYYTGAEYTVAFSAGAFVGFYNAEQTVMFQNILYAVGGGYDKGTGVFTVPKSGLYIIFCNIMAYSRIGNFWAKMMINGVTKTGVMAYDGSSHVDAYYSGSNLIVQQLQVNDRVWIQTVNKGFLYSNYPDSIFTVVMIKSLE